MSRSRSALFCLCLLLLALLGATAAQAGRFVIWTGNGPNGNWSEPANWTGSPPASGETVSIKFDWQAARKSMNLNVANVTCDSMEFEWMFTLSASPGCKLTLVADPNYPVVSGQGGCEFAASLEIVLINEVRFCIGDGVRFSGLISGTGGLDLRGDRYIFDGTVPNTFTGPTTIAGSDVFLQSTAGPCLANPVLVKDEFDCYGDPGDFGDPDGRLIVQNAAAIGTNMNLELVFAQACFTNANATINHLKLTCGSIFSGTHTLTVLGSIEQSPYNGYTDSYFIGNVNLPPPGNGLRIINLGSSCNLSVTGQVSGAGTKLVKTGYGTLFLNSANAFTGGLRVDQGDVYLNVAGAQGLNAGIIELGTNTSLWLGDNVAMGNAILAHENSALRGATNAVCTGNIQTDGVNFILSNVEASGVISGSARLRLRYAAKLTGNQSNTHTGGTLVDYTDAAAAWFAKTGGALAVPGALELDTDGKVKWGGPNQVPATTAVVMHNGSVLDLNGYNQSLDSLALHCARVETGAGQLTLAQSVLVVNTNAEPNWGNPPTNSTVNGHLTFPAGTHAFNVQDEAGLILAAAVHAPAGATLQKTGPGRLVLGGNSDFDAPFQIVSGRVVATNGAAFGNASAGTYVNGGTILELGANPVAVAGEPLDLYGSLVASNGVQTWNGSIVLHSADQLLASAGATLRMGGALSGNVNFHHVTPGMIEFTGTAVNSWTGVSEVRQGTLRLSRHAPGLAIPGPSIAVGGFGWPAALELNGNNGLADTAIVTKSTDGALRVLAFEDTFGAVAGTGDIELLGGGLSLSNNAATTLDARLTGAGYFAKRGTGQLVSAPNHDCASVVVQRGNLQLLGQLTGVPVTVNSNGVLSGVARVGNLTINGGGKLAPGIAGPGSLTAINLVMQPNATLEVDLALSNAPADTVECNSATLNSPNLTSTPASTNAATNTVSKIINIKPATPLVGQFNGFPNGSSIKLGGKFWVVNYEGGNGNDTMLYALGSIPPVEIGGISVFHGNAIHLTGTGLPNVTYTVEASGDLGNPAAWQPIGTATGGVHGELFFSDPNYLNFSKRFYRFISQ